LYLKGGAHALDSAKKNMCELRMLYPWPLDVDETELDASLKIAMDYLAMTGQAEPLTDVQRRVAIAILAAWRAGIRHHLRLANYGIRSVENNEQPGSGLRLTLVKKTPR